MSSKLLDRQRNSVGSDFQTVGPATEKARWPNVIMMTMIIFIHTIMCRDRQTDRPKKQYNQYRSQNTKARKTSQTDALKYPRDCRHTEYTEHSLLNS